MTHETKNFRVIPDFVSIWIRHMESRIGVVDWQSVSAGGRCRHVALRSIQHRFPFAPCCRGRSQRARQTEPDATLEQVAAESCGARPRPADFLLPVRDCRDYRMAAARQPPTFHWISWYVVETWPNTALHRNSRCASPFRVYFHLGPFFALHHFRPRLWVSLRRSPSRVLHVSSRWLCRGFLRRHVVATLSA